MPATVGGRSRSGQPIRGTRRRPAERHHPRPRQSCSCGRSAPIVVPTPCPGCTTASSGSTANSRCSTSSSSCVNLAASPPVLPTPPGNRESPVKHVRGAVAAAVHERHRPRGVAPQVHDLQRDVPDADLVAVGEAAVHGHGQVVGVVLARRGPGAGGGDDVGERTHVVPVPVRGDDPVEGAAGDALADEAQQHGCLVGGVHEHLGTGGPARQQVHAVVHRRRPGWCGSPARPCAGAQLSSVLPASAPVIVLGHPVLSAPSAPPGRRPGRRPRARAPGATGPAGCCRRGGRVTSYSSLQQPDVVAPAPQSRSIRASASSRRPVRGVLLDEPERAGEERMLVARQPVDARTRCGSGAAGRRASGRARSRRPCRASAASSAAQKPTCGEHAAATASTSGVP